MPWVSGDEIVRRSNSEPDSSDRADQRFHDMYDKAEEEIKKQDEERARKAAERAARDEDSDER